MDKNEFFLLNASDGEIENLRSLLNSRVKSNELLAVGMMAVGGLPLSLLEDVFKLYVSSHTGYTKHYTREKVLLGVKSEIENLFVKFDLEILILPAIGRKGFQHAQPAFEKFVEAGISLDEYAHYFPVEFVMQNDNFSEAGRVRSLKTKISNFETELNLINLGLEKIPDVIGQFDRLKRADLRGNKLKQLPVAFAELKNLRELVLRTNRFEGGITAISNNLSLQYLDLSENRLNAIGEEIVSLQHLNWLFLSNNFIADLPEEFVNLSNLEKLELSGNAFTGIPAVLGKLKNLQALNLSENKIQFCSLEPGQLPRLSLLNLEGNPIVKNEAEIEKLKQSLPRNCELKL